MTGILQESHIQAVYESDCGKQVITNSLATFWVFRVGAMIQIYITTNLLECLQGILLKKERQHR